MTTPPPSGEEEAAAEKEQQYDVKFNTRRLLSLARSKKPQKRGQRKRPEGAGPVKRVRNRTRTVCSIAPCKGEVEYHQLKRHLEQCHDEVSCCYLFSHI